MGSDASERVGYHPGRLGLVGMVIMHMRAPFCFVFFVLLFFVRTLSASHTVPGVVDAPVYTRRRPRRLRGCEGAVEVW